jgi:hypothetical protein
MGNGNFSPVIPAKAGMTGEKLRATNGGKPE